MLLAVATILLVAPVARAACPRGEILAQKLDQQLVSNGCTKPDFLTVQGEEDFTHCCDRHDVCYSTCGMTHSFCDEDFKKCMINLCDKVFPENAACKGAANTYSMGTSLFGADLFTEGQRDHCVCVNSDNLLSHYKTYAEQFYAQHVPPESAKNPATIFTEKSKYIKNSGTETSPQYKNIHKIVYDLHKKYDSAIGHVDARKAKGVSYPKPPPAVKKEF